MSKGNKSFPGFGLQTPIPLYEILEEEEEIEESTVAEVDPSEFISDETKEEATQVINEEDDIPEDLKKRVLRDNKGRPIKYNGKIVIFPFDVSHLFGKGI